MQQVFCPNCARLVVADDINIAAPRREVRRGTTAHLPVFQQAERARRGTRFGVLLPAEGPSGRGRSERVVHETGFDGELDLRMRPVPPP